MLPAGSRLTRVSPSVAPASTPNHGGSPRRLVTSASVLKQVFFCIGAAKTGTTILARMLDQQPGVACMSEAYFLAPTSKASLFNTTNHVGARHGFSAARIAEWHERALRKLVVDGEEVDAISDPDFVRELITDVLSLFGDREGASIVGEKWPYYHNSIGLMLEAFPDGKFLYNVRDPRAVWNSGETFRERGVGDRVLAEMLLADERIRGLDDERIFTFRYEDLIREPHGVMATIADFVGFEFHPEALDYDESSDRLSNRWNWVPTAKGDLDPALTEKWRTEMSPGQQAEVTNRCAEFVERYGYPTE